MNGGELENYESDEDEEDKELLVSAKKLQSLNNLQPLKILCMKTVVRNFDSISNSTLVEKLPVTVKTSFLEHLTQLNNDGKIIPLSTEQRLELIEMLLHRNLKVFDFSLLIGQDFEFTDFSQEREFLAKWEAVYARMWTSLAAKCPDLLDIRDHWPIHPNRPNPVNLRSKLDKKVFTFSKLISLDSHCYIDSGCIDEICDKLKHLKMLKVSYYNYDLPDFGNLSRLENLQEVHLYELDLLLRVILSDRNPFESMTKLKNYSITSLFGTLFASEHFFEHQRFCALERLNVDFQTENDIMRVAANFPNLRYLETTCFPVNLDPGLFLHFKNLTTLEITYEKHTLRILALIGPKLKEVKFKVHVNSLGENVISFDLLEVLTLCPNLESFEFLKFRGEVNLQGPDLVVANLKLKKVFLSGDFYFAEGFLSIILSAPLLEDVTLNTFNTPINDTVSLKTLLSKREIFQNVTSVVMAINVGFDLREMEKLARYIVGFCPKLKRAVFSSGPFGDWRSLKNVDNLMTSF